MVNFGHSILRVEDLFAENVAAQIILETNVRIKKEHLRKFLVMIQMRFPHIHGQLW